VVRYAANYYLTSNVGLNSSAGTDWGTPGASTSWESFGAQFSSVATDILLAQDVYADRTVNVGASGSNPVIQLYADYPTNANPAIKINLGTQGFSGTGGIFIGFDSTTPKLSLVNSTNTKYLKWTGSDLEVKGTINADAGVIGGFAITENAISSSNNKLILRNNGEITGSAINLLSGSLAGWSIDPSGISYSENVTVGYQTVSSSTIIANSAVFPPELVTNLYSVNGDYSTIQIPSTGTVYNVTSRPSTSTLIIDTLIYRTPSSFKLIYSSGSFVGPNLTDGTRPGTWRADYVNQFDPAPSETWDVKWEINTASGSTYTLGDNTYAPGYSLIKVTSGSLDSYFELSDIDINKLIDESVIRRYPTPLLYDSGINYPILTIRDSYDVNNAGAGPFLDGPAFRARSFRVVDIINESNPTSTSGYDTFVLGLEVGGGVPFEDYFEAFELNYGISELKENQEWDNNGGGGQPSVFNTLQLQLFDSVTKTSTTDFGGATVTAGFLSSISASIEAVRLASSGSNNSNKPYLSMGQTTQSFDETGIFIGYSSGSSQERMSLKSSDGQKFFKWTGTDVEVKGTINADAGVIGGFEITDFAISSSQYITSGSGTSFNAQPKLALKANGEISGSDLRIIRKAGNDFYTLIDTTNGILDATNLGRQVISDYTEYERSNVDDDANFFEAVSYPFVLLPNENKIGIACTISNYKNAATSNISEVRFSLAYMVTGSTSSTSGTSGLARYDFSEGLTTLRTHTLSNPGGYISRTIGPADGSSYMFDIPTSMLSKYVVLKVFLKNNTIGSATGTYTRVKGISVNVGRGFSANTSIGTIAPNPGAPSIP
jgi:hypothetical protein